jgi:signal recognition particle GTPase
VLSRDHLDDDAWEEIEDSLISADVGVEATQVIVQRLRERVGCSAPAPWPRCASSWPRS